MSASDSREDLAPPQAAGPPNEVASLEKAASPAGGQVFCTECGEENPAHARYCWNCGAGIHAAAVSEAPLATDPSASAAPLRPPAVREAPAGGADNASKYAMLLVGGAALLVIVLFAVTQLAGTATIHTPQGGATSDGAPASTPLSVPPEVMDRISALEDELVETSDPAGRLAIRDQLVETLVRVGAFARAGEVQEAIAREVGTADAWADAGSFYLAHMLRSEAAERSIFAERSALAYEQALELTPEDLDVKTDLATAYLNHPQEPMRAVALVQEVLEENPRHARARFNYGLMLSQIGRNDQARQQFEDVIATTDPADFVHERALEELQRLPPSAG